MEVNHFIKAVATSKISNLASSADSEECYLVPVLLRFDALVINGTKMKESDVTC